MGAAASRGGGEASTGSGATTGALASGASTTGPGAGASVRGGSGAGAGGAQRPSKSTLVPQAERARAQLTGRLSETGVEMAMVVRAP